MRKKKKAGRKNFKRFLKKFKKAVAK